jgi:aminoglycoside phosphotransferase (APT) family kinase protein
MDTRIAQWLSEVLDPSFTQVRSLSFGISSELDLLESDGDLFVLRRYARRDQLERHPRRVADELTALEAATAVLGELVPKPIAFDVTGTLTGQPVILMTYLSGTPVIHDLDPALLVGPLVRLHRAQVDMRLPQFQHWFDRQRMRVPHWSSSRDAWKRLAELVSAAQPAAPEVFLHRDYHPGNLLWSEGRMTGIVDWVVACRGPAAADVAHTRCNLVLTDGFAAAERFLTEYKSAEPTYQHDLWWDAAELFTWDDEFSGVMALNAFGAGLDLELLRSRADRFADEICEHVEGGT